MKRIPKSFELMGHQITVRIVSKRGWEELAESSEEIDEDDFGAWFPAQNLILIKRNKQSLMMHTFVHELTHAVLDMLSNDLSYNEVFVDNFGGLLAQALSTAK